MLITTLLVRCEQFEKRMQHWSATSAEGQDRSHATPAVEMGRIQGWQSVCRDAADDADDDRRCCGVFVILAPDTNCILTYLLTGLGVLARNIEIRV